jgi:signal transduction histidine kinase
MAPMAGLPLRGLTIRAALLLGFALTVGLWVFAAYQLTRQLATVESGSAAINERYTRGQELLSNVRAQVLLGSVYVRDALLDPNPASADEYRRRIADTHAAVDRAIESYVPVLDSPAERQALQRLRDEIAAFRMTLVDVMPAETDRRPAAAYAMLRDRVVPRREQVIRVSEEVQALNRLAFVERQRQIAEIYSSTQRRMWQQLGLALATSIGIALVAALYAGRLEIRLRRQVARNLDTTRDLQRLSGQLISAQEEERRTIARELHDEVGQVLTAIKMELALAERTIDAAGGPSQVLANARSIADGALQSVRDLSRLLHPSLLDDLGLPAAIHWYLKGFGQRHALRAEMLHDGASERLTSDTEAALFRIAQEALTNVAKHARATTCRVYLQRLPNTVLVTVEDDGIGFDPAAVESADGHRGLGLISIRERVARLGGTFRVESSPGKGARVTIEVPARPRTTEPAEREASTDARTAHETL